MPPRKPTPVTPELPGTEGVINERIDKLAREYVESRDARMAALEFEVELKGKLIAAMKEEKMDTYKHKDIQVVLTTKESIKVKADGSEADGGEGEDPDDQFN